MNSKKRIWIVLIVMAAFVGILSYVYLSQRTIVPENSIEIIYNNQTKTIDLDHLELIQVQGETINGKGEINTIDTTGIELKVLLDNNDIHTFDSLTIEADDAYTASVSFDEVQEDNQIYVLVEDGKATLVVFKDTNSKRNVRDVIRLVVES